MRFGIRSLLWSASLGTLAACSGREAPAPPTDEGPPPMPGAPGRLLVTDAERPVVRVIDLGEGRVVDELPLASPGLLVPGSRGFAYVVQPGADRIDALDPGRVEDDGTVVEPRSIRATVRGPRPTWLLANAGIATAFFAGDGSVAWWPEAAVGADDFDVAPRPIGPAHDGLALAFGDDELLVSFPGDATPPTPPSLDLWSRTREPTRVERFAGCAEPRSAAGSERAVAVGCRDLVYYVRLDPETGDVSGEPLAVPVFDGQARVDRLRLAPDGELLVGTYGDDTLVRVEPPEVTRVQLPDPIVDLRFVGPDRTLAVLLEGGALIEAGAVEGPTGRAVRVFGEAPPEDLTLVVGRDAVFVADAGSGRVVEIPLATWRVARVFDLGGRPTSGLAFPGPHAFELRD